MKIATRTELAAGQHVPQDAAKLSRLFEHSSTSGWTHSLLWAAVAVTSFYAAHSRPYLSWLTLPYLFALLQIARGSRWRMAFYPGVAVGLLTAITRLEFFWTIFSFGAVALWLVYAVWIGVFTTLARKCLQHPMGIILVPFVWTGVEYFRSELYFLKFSWLSPGYTFGEAPWQVPFHALGVYGVGFLLMTVACLSMWLWRTSKYTAMAVLILSPALLLVSARGGSGLAAAPSHVARIAGIQLEFPTDRQILEGLKELVRKYPEAELLVLSEYSLQNTVPEAVRRWVAQNRRYLVIGGKDPAPPDNFYNTAFVIGPDGETVFKQVKSVPIQFFKDGLPARQQSVWDSPWGKIGFCICYDLSYRRVTDRLVRAGAQALIVPTMDVADWGYGQHRLHARVTPVRASEYGIPMFRLASSGISQAVDAHGTVLTSAPFPGEGATLRADMAIGPKGRLPADHWLAPMAFAVTFIFALYQVVCALLVYRSSRNHPGGSVGL